MGRVGNKILPFFAPYLTSKFEVESYLHALWPSRAALHNINTYIKNKLTLKHNLSALVGKTLRCSLLLSSCCMEDSANFHLKQV